MNNENDYVLQQQIIWFGKTIYAGTIYRQKGLDYYWPIINGAHVPTMQVDFMTVKNNPDYFKLKEEVKPYVSNVKYDGHTYIFTLNMGTEQSKTITVERDRLAEILIAEDKNKLIIEGFSNTEKYYTEKEYIQGLEDAFNSATDKTDNIIGKAKYISGYSENIFEDKYKSFSDYMNWKTIIQPS